MISKFLVGCGQKYFWQSDLGILKSIISQEQLGRWAWFFLDADIYVEGKIKIKGDLKILSHDLV